jgi:hypothetical protein
MVGLGMICGSGLRFVLNRPLKNSKKRGIRSGGGVRKAFFFEKKAKNF